MSIARSVKEYAGVLHSPAQAELTYEQNAGPASPTADLNRLGEFSAMRAESGHVPDDRLRLRADSTAHERIGDDAAARSAREDQTRHRSCSALDMLSGMAEWLSFWNQETRARNSNLAGGPVDEIYVPYGRDRIGRRDRIYCVGIENGRLLLITRVRAALLEADIADDEMIYVDDSDEEYVEADFDRIVPGSVIGALRVIYVDGSEHPISCDAAGRVQGNAYEGRSSIRELVAGADQLDDLLD